MLPRCSLIGRTRFVLPVVAALATFLLVTAPVAAQETGSVTGQVIDQTNNRPLNGAQVVLEGIQRGALSDARGRYLITNVPAGTYSVRVTFIGYGTQTVDVSVPAGGVATANFGLGISAIAMDEVVVTGTAGAVERRKLGQAVASVNMAQLQDVVPIENFGNALQARIPGVRSVGTVGGVGAGRDLRIRGMSSFSLNQRPVVYIDGVRIDASQYEWAGGNVNGGTCCSFSGGAGEDRLGDLNPEEIDRIEILKGAAAATLYGSEASNGVIQIFTKRGRSNSRPRFTLSSNIGFNRHRENFQTKLYPNFTGPGGVRALDANQALIQNGLVNNWDLTAQGGGEDVTYFVSGGFNFEEGSVQPNWQKKGNMRMNLRWVASDKWTFAINTAYSRNRILALQSGNNWMSLLGNAVLGNPQKATEERPYGEPWLAISDIQEVETYSDASRWTGGITTTFNPTEFFSNRLTLGLDQVDEQKSRILPFGHYYTYIGERGEKNLGYRTARNITADYLGTLNFDIMSDLDSELSFGAQGFWETATTQMAIGQEYAGPGVTSVGGGALTFGDEFFLETVNVGIFAQNRFGWKDKLFATVGLRVDGNSAFGENYGLQTYPKIDVAYHISEEGILPEVISNLKLRGAIGQAGMFPGAFDQFQTYTPTAVLNDVPGVTPNNPGNADLMPETTTEIEVGFDAGFFDDRLGATFTFYRAVTKDALLNVNLPSSAGFSQSRKENAGEITNTGWEATINFAPVNTADMRWSVDVALDGNKNEITKLGDQATWYKFFTGELDASGNQINDSVSYMGGSRLGYPVQGEWTRQIIGYDATTNKHTRSGLSKYWGPTLPTFNASLGNTFTYGPFRVYGLLSMENGALFSNGDRPFRIRQGAGDELLSLLNPDGSATTQSDSLVNFYTLQSAIDSRDNIRIRELSATYTLPDDLLSQWGFGRTTITASAMNVWWWDDCNCMDPSMNYRGGDSYSFSGFLAMPQPRQFLLSIRTSF